MEAVYDSNRRDWTKLAIMVYNQSYSKQLLSLLLFTYQQITEQIGTYQLNRPYW